MEGEGEGRTRPAVTNCAITTVVVACHIVADVVTFAVSEPAPSAAVLNLAALRLWRTIVTIVVAFCYVALRVAISVSEPVAASTLAAGTTCLLALRDNRRTGRCGGAA